MDRSDFWDPTFEITHREDGAILMRQTGDLTGYLPTLADYLDTWADATPDQTWIARRDGAGDWQRITYGDARRKVRAIGAALLDMGLERERPLLILSGNSIEHALLGAACFYVGIPYAPVSPAYSTVSTDHTKLKDIARVLRPGALFADDGAVFAKACAAIAETGRQVIGVRNLAPGAIAFEDLLTHDPDAAIEARARVTAEDTVKYLFTSGSTGSPKGVINTNGMITSMQAMVRDCYRFLTKRPPVVVDWAPWNHTAGGNKIFYLVLTNGGTYYIDDGKPVPGRFDETLRNLRDIPCTWYFNVPAGWDMIVGALEDDPAFAQTFFNRLDMMFYAGAGMAQHTWDRLRAIGRRTTGSEVLLATGLGSTETAPFALAWTEVEEEAGNVGVPSKGLEMKLVPAGDKLELRLKGPSITPGYHGDAEKTAEAFDDEGFLIMGDALRPADPDDLTRGLFFDGRIAENFKLTTGTWVAVGALRAEIVNAMGGLIRDAVITGENTSEVGALLFLSEEARAMERTELDRLLQDRLTASARAATGSASRVARAMILADPPDFDRGEITEKGSLSQRALRANRAGEIARLYAGGPGVIIA